MVTEANKTISEPRVIFKQGALVIPGLSNQKIKITYSGSVSIQADWMTKLDGKLSACQGE
jgi:hypothetical protein